MTADPGFEDHLAAMSDEELEAVDLATLDRDGQNALLRETSRRARLQEAEESRRADITYWKLRGKLLRWALVAILAGVLAVAYGLVE